MSTQFEQEGTPLVQEPGTLPGETNSTAASMQTSPAGLHTEGQGDTKQTTVVLLHGLGMGQWMWQPQIDVLSAHYHVLVPDLPGFAGSAADGPFTMDKAATSVAQLIRTHGHGPAHICGLSLGAMVALQLYQHAPELVASLILSGGQIHPNPFLMALQDTIMRCIPERQLTETSPRFFREQYPELVEPSLTAARQTGKRNLLMTTRTVGQSDLRPILPTITVPTLVLCGSKDRFNLSASRQISKSIPGAELRIVPDAGHIWNLEQPQLFTRTIRAFLQKVEVK